MSKIIEIQQRLIAFLEDNGIDQWVETDGQNVRRVDFVADLIGDAYVEGRNAVSDDDYEAGLEAGHQQGYDEGYADALAESEDK